LGYPIVFGIMGAGFSMLGLAMIWRAVKGFQDYPAPTEVDESPFVWKRGRTLW